MDSIQFEKEFPDIGRAEKTPQDLERELLAMRLLTDNLGKTEKYANDNVWTHVAVTSSNNQTSCQQTLSSSVA